LIEENQREKEDRIGTASHFESEHAPGGNGTPDSALIIIIIIDLLIAFFLQQSFQS
jgi:hypothetical protein